MPGYTLSDGVTLKNKFGANNVDELAQFETEAVRRRLMEIELGVVPSGQFDAVYLKTIHRHLFQDVYEWAGHTRDERFALSDGTVATEPIMRKVEGQPFVTGQAIPTALEEVATRLRESKYLRGFPRTVFAKEAADIMVSLNAIHPFREGNGRTQRTFMRELAKNAGHALDFSIVSSERMTQASISAHEHGDPSMMRRMFDEISDPERSLLLRKSIAVLERLNFNWNDRYVATLTPGYAVELVLAGIAGDQFMGRTQTDILFGRSADLPVPHPKSGETVTIMPTPYSPSNE